MTKAKIAGGTLAALIVLIAVALGYRALNHDAQPPAIESPEIPPSTTLGTNAPTKSPTQAPARTYQGFLYGRVTSGDGIVYEGRLRFGDGEEAFWGDYFNGLKSDNPWLVQVPPEQLPKEHHPIEVFGLTLIDRQKPIEVRRQLRARFGEIARIEPSGFKVVQVTLKSGTVFAVNRFDASDFDDGLRVWDAARGVVDLDSLQIRTIELLPTPSLSAVPDRLHGTVHTSQGDFSGFLQWDRTDCFGEDELVGRTADGELRVRFDTIRSITSSPLGSCTVALLDGGEIVLSGTREVGDRNRGIDVDDPRFGRVLISWEAFERVDFSPGGSGPAYEDFPPGRPITGSVTTRAGVRLAGRLVFDLDESETTETLDSSWQGVDYAIPFGLVASIVAPDGEANGDQHAGVILHGGEELQLERDGDLGEQNAGVLVFVEGVDGVDGVEGGPRGEYVSWADVERIDFDRPVEMYPPIGGR